MCLKRLPHVGHCLTPRWMAVVKSFPWLHGLQLDEECAHILTVMVTSKMSKACDRVNMARRCSVCFYVFCCKLYSGRFSSACQQIWKHHSGCAEAQDVVSCIHLLHHEVGRKSGLEAALWRPTTKCRCRSDDIEFSSGKHFSSAFHSIKT